MEKVKTKKKRKESKDRAFDLLFKNHTQWFYDQDDREKAIHKEDLSLYIVSPCNMNQEASTFSLGNFSDKTSATNVS